jgi:hypothetical protein
MPVERCWRCKELKPDVSLAPSDDRLCHECYIDNERQLLNLRKQATDTVTLQESGAVGVNSANSKTRSGRSNEKKTGKKQATKLTTLELENLDATNQQNDAIKPPISEAVVTGVNHQQIDDANEVPTGSHLLVHQACNVEAEVHALRQQVQNQQAEIKSLRQQLEVMISYLGLKDMEAGESDTELKSDPVLPSQKEANESDVNDSSPGNNPLWSEVVSRKHRSKRPESFQQAVVAAVYVDQTLKKSRERRLVITGLKSTSAQTDEESFDALCRTDLRIQPDIVFTKRLGRPIAGKIQPLLVTLKQAEQAQEIIKSAKLLRKSSDAVTRSSVYINPQMTRAEAEAAYQLRLHRRITQQRRSVQDSTAGRSAGDSSRQPVDGEGVRSQRQNVGDNKDSSNGSTATQHGEPNIAYD